MILGDQGADVIKVETPDGGDHTRAGGNRRGGLAASFLNNNRNKRSIALDLKTADGVARVKRLAAGADVFVQNFRPGVVERLGLGEDEIRAARRHHLCLDQRLRRERAVRAKGGLRPDDPGLLRARHRAGRLGRGAAAAAAHDPSRQADRHHRLAGDHRGAGGAQATGKGQHVRLSMLDAVLAFLWASDMGGQTFVGTSRRSRRRRAPST